MDKSTISQTGPTGRRQARLENLEARLSTFRAYQSYAGGLPPLVATQLSALQSNIRNELREPTIHSCS